MLTNSGELLLVHVHLKELAIIHDTPVVSGEL